MEELLDINTHGKVTNCSSSGIVSGTSYTGGLIGQFENITVEGSSSTATPKGSSQIGGLVGGGRTIAIKDSSSEGTVIATGSNVGGLIGYIGTTGNIDTTFAKGNVEGVSDSVGGLIGYFKNGTVNNSYADRKCKRSK